MRREDKDKDKDGQTLDKIVITPRLLSANWFVITWSLNFEFVPVWVCT